MYIKQIMGISFSNFMKNTKDVELQKELDTKTKELDAKNIELDAKTKELDAKTKELDAKNIELDAKQIKLDTKTKKLDELNKNKISQVNNLISQIKSQLKQGYYLNNSIYPDIWTQQSSNNLFKDTPSSDLLNDIYNILDALARALNQELNLVSIRPDDDKNKLADKINNIVNKSENKAYLNICSLTSDEELLVKRYLPLFQIFRELQQYYNELKLMN